jgi:hypothetical protein
MDVDGGQAPRTPSANGEDTGMGLSAEAFEASGWESRIYVIWPEVVTVFDERRFGTERWIEASVG